MKQLRCELVSNCIFVLLIINFKGKIRAVETVVNWFQIESLSYWLSTQKPFNKIDFELWIGFKLYLCLIDYQQEMTFHILTFRCELVSNCIFVLLIINLPGRYQVVGTVVNWFQIVSLSYWLSTIELDNYRLDTLWIGFKLYLCLIDYQPIPRVELNPPTGADSSLQI